MNRPAMPPNSAPESTAKHDHERMQVKAMPDQPGINHVVVDHAQSAQKDDHPERQPGAWSAATMVATTATTDGPTSGMNSRMPARTPSRTAYGTPSSANPMPQTVPISKHATSWARIYDGQGLVQLLGRR